MPAREKLNVAYFHGSLFMASLVGLMANSWPVFVVTLFALLAGNVIAGQIRPKPRQP